MREWSGKQNRNQEGRAPQKPELDPDMENLDPDMEEFDLEMGDLDMEELDPEMGDLDIEESDPEMGDLDVEDADSEMKDLDMEDAVLDMEAPDMNDRDEEDNDWEDEPESGTLWLRVLFILGLVLLIVLLSFGIWYLTHPEKQEEGGNNRSDATGQTSETIPESDMGQVTDPNGEEATESSVGQTAESDSGVSQEPGDEPGEEVPDQEEVDAGGVPWEETPGDAPMSFAQVYESVTPKDVVNLRSAPTTMDDGNIVVQIWNGEVLLRTGINEDKGWSEIEYNDQILYAVNSFLTTDLDFKTPVSPSDPNWVSTQDGRVIIFTDCDDWVSPKEYVNLRTEPSTSEGDATVRLQLNYGESVHRTGYSADSGWSRVEVNGEVLYVVSSLVYVVAE